MALDAFLHSGVRPRKGRITAAFCNVAAFTRFDEARPDDSRFVDEDFNRVWALGRLNGPGRSAELDRARALRPFVERATFLLDLHSMHEPCEPLLVTGLLQRNIDFAQSLGLGAQVIVDAGHDDGVRMRDFNRLAEPARSEISLLLEAGQHWDPSSLQTARNTPMRFLVASGVIEGGEVIPHAGALIATDAAEPVLAPYDDCVLIMPSVKQLRPGVTTVRLGRRA
ncbi:succinylglutamate desuccinylase/aspartoacylase domain-containing protein [Polaromonas jejuensis]|uniref:Succinylglutamate desuccinylase/aspartoacylase family protein n=1 Tax=Polaromonas jejuensis TaxID=457502 RepID=A0ABW0Q532_9BURK